MQASGLRMCGFRSPQTRMRALPPSELQLISRAVSTRLLLHARLLTELQRLMENQPVRRSLDLNTGTTPFYLDPSNTKDPENTLDANTTTRPSQSRALVGRILPVPTEYLPVGFEAQHLYRPPVSTISAEAPQNHSIGFSNRDVTRNNGELRSNSGSL